MTTLKPIWILVVYGILLFTSCQLKNNAPQVKPDPFDSNSIVAPGVVGKIVINQDGYFIDTGAYITIKGKGFDPKFRNDYFLDVRHPGDNYSNKDDTLARAQVKNSSLYDKNLLTISDTAITFKLPKYVLGTTTDDTAYFYFLKLKRGSGRQNYNFPELIDFTGYIKSKQTLPILPVYKLIKDTLFISEKYNGQGKEMIRFSSSSGYFKILIHGLEYPEKPKYFLNRDDYTVPLYYKTTISMVATQDLFFLPDGWHDLEVYQRADRQRRCVEETGKKLIYLKNVP